MSSRLVWSTELVPGQLGLHGEMLSKKQNVIEKAKMLSEIIHIQKVTYCMCLSTPSPV